MRGSFLYLSLGLLFCVLPVLCENYHVHSQNPDRFIVSTGYEKDGDLVETVPKSNKGFPLHTVVDIDPPVSDTEPTEGVVSGKAGLFIGISKVGNELEWHTKPYKWVFNLATEDPYHMQVSSVIYDLRFVH
ncbi:hypothetical protein F5887DRAFT_87219 [Amanita rubescens]|nr:hypothetical protein F5887DRAFT_87219 [Amanita rubescens]